MSDYLDYAGLSTYDEQIKAYINIASGNSNGVKIITLSTIPDATTLSYNGYNFKPGDEVRVLNGDKYVFYRLHTIENGEALWMSIADSTTSEGVTISINMISNQNESFNLGSATISYEYEGNTVTDTLSGESATFEGLPSGVEYTISFGNATGYASPQSITGVTPEFGQIGYSVLYKTELLSVTSVTIDTGSVIGLEITINNETKTWNGSTLTWKIPFGSSDAITGAKSGYNLKVTKSPSTDIADSATKTATLAYTAIKSGIFVIDANGNEVDAVLGDSSYIGVVVRDADNGIAFILDKNVMQKNNIEWSQNNYSSDAAGITEFTDHDSSGVASAARTKSLQYFKNGETGIANTNIIKAFDSTVDNNAALYCYNQTKTIKGQTVHGYLGTFAEWVVIHDNFQAVNTALSKIGGTQFSGNNLWWTSAEYSTIYAWVWYYHSGSPYFFNNNKGFSNFYAVPFYPIPS